MIFSDSSLLPRFFFAKSCLVLGLLTTPALADWSGAPRLTGFSPRGWQRGTTVDVEFRGVSMKDPRGVLFLSTDKIRVLKTTALPPSEDPRRRDGRDRVSATLEIAPDCPLGQQPMRVLTSAGLSDVVLFYVGAMETVTEEEDKTDRQREDVNGKRESAQPVALNQTVNGTLNTLPAGMEQDWFRIEAKKGQLISVEAECARLCPSEREDGFEPKISLHDAEGKVLATSASTPLLLIDPWIAAAAPADGTYYVSIAAELPPANNRPAPYRLHVGEFRRPAAVYPAGGNPGQKLGVRLIGLPAGANDKAEITLPAQEGAFAYHADAATPTANPLRVLAGPNVLEQEPNNDANSATAVPAGATVPFAVNGILEQPGDTDSFHFGAKKGEKLNIRLHGQALGVPVDARFEIAKAGKSGGERSDDSNDDALGYFDAQTTRERLDPSDIWSAPEDGDYILTVTDVRGAGGPEFVYRVEFTAVREGLLTTLLPQDNNAKLSRNSVNVGRGNRMTATVGLKPAPGADPKGDFTLVAKNLPAGVKMTADKFTASDRRVNVLFEAAADAPVAAANVELLAVPADAEAAKSALSAFNQAVPIITLGNDPVWQVMLDALSFSVIDDVPFTLTVAPPQAPLSKNAETTVELTLTRKPGFTDGVEILLEQPPRGVIGQQGVMLTGDQSKFEFRLSADGNVAPGKYPLVLSARNRSGDNRTGAGKMWAASAAVPLEVSDPWFRVKFARARIERGQKATMTGTIEKLRDFSGKATAALIRLPRGLSLSAPVTLGADNNVTFQLEASPDALVGSYNGVACEIVVENGDSTLKQIAGYGSLRVDPARKAE